MENTGDRSYVCPYALLLCVVSSNCENEHTCGSLFTYEFASGTTTGIIQLMHYTLCDSVYYYDVDENFPETRNNLDAVLESRSISLS